MGRLPAGEPEVASPDACGRFPFLDPALWAGCRFPGSDRVTAGPWLYAELAKAGGVAVVAAAHGALDRDVVTDHC